MGCRSEMTTQELRHWAMNGGNIPSAEIVSLCDRLVAYERNTVKRDDSVPEWALAWAKAPPGHAVGLSMAVGTVCFWIPKGGNHLPDAPDLRPDEPGPITLPIVDVGP